ncbi:hypothetical protein P256_00242 [Acinetobacter nectaris CIP 110549]|uniref:Uncharacterized protein n=1 Tax=Acinetobacter nectaris CIP 110549 TaxID=1392540 RepID=V2TGL0_9GAMM|nr:hypothetical protein [Acinetobacter nectaris]ESK41253.1 hypothetical protein P256_00242 [Acinetobacter nectaris CIP 110549]
MIQHSNWIIFFSNGTFEATFTTPIGSKNISYMLAWLYLTFNQGKVIKDGFNVSIRHSDKALKVEVLDDISQNKINEIWKNAVGQDDKYHFSHPIVNINNNGKISNSSNDNITSGFQGLIDPFNSRNTPKNMVDVIEGMKIKYQDHTKFMQKVLDEVFEDKNIKKKYNNSDGMIEDYDEYE